MATTRIGVQKANGGTAVETTVVADDTYLFSNRGSTVGFFVVPTAQSAKKISLSTFRNSAGKDFDAAPDELDVANAANGLYIIANLLTNVYNNDKALVEFKSSAAGTLIVADKAS